MKQSILVLALLIVSAQLAAQSLPDFEPILLPVFSERTIEGVGGSKFSTVLYVTSDVPFRFFPSAFGEGAIGTVQPYVPLVPIPSDATRLGKGRVLFVERANVGNVQFGYHLASTDAAGVAREQRTNLPVVRERDLRRGRTELIGIPNRPIIEYPNGVAGVVVGQRLRHTLRIYDVDAIGGVTATVSVHVTNMAGNTTLRTFTVPLNQREGSDASFPWYGEVAVELPCLPFSLHTPCISYDARLSIALDRDIRYWTFVSSTDNTTQHVSLTIPQ
jgi:hypothetical protein